ncbi:MAG: N-acetylneuraminic acid mutarotase [Salibacteraceae bacterium]|jgi:N-acetylneuraminic acid mutarotase
MRLLLLLSFCLFGHISESIAASQWQQRANFGSFGRHRGTGVGIANKAYCGLGHLNGAPGIDYRFPDWWEYDPAANSWAQKADYPANGGNGDQDVVVMPLETVAFVGMGEVDQTNWFKYHAQTNLWTDATDPPVGATFHNEHAFTIGHKGYFPALFSSNFWEYDADLDLWTQRASIPISTQFGNPTFAIGDKGYIKISSFFYEYDPALDTWTMKAPYPGLFPNRPKGIHQNGYGYIIGGMDASWTWCPEVWRYDPTNDSWLQLQDFPGTTRRWATAVNVGGRVYYGLGTNGTNFNDFWEFNPVAATEEFAIDKFKMYPNPAIDQVNFSSDQYQEFDIALYDLLGNSISTVSAINGKAQMNRQSFASGTYLYRVMVDGKSVHSDRVVFF